MEEEGEGEEDRGEKAEKDQSIKHLFIVLQSPDIYDKEQRLLT